MGVYSLKVCPSILLKETTKLVAYYKENKYAGNRIKKSLNMVDPILQEIKVNMKDYIGFISRKTKRNQGFGKAKI